MNIEPKTKHFKKEKEEKESKEDMEEKDTQEDYYRGDGTYVKDTEQTKQDYGNTWD